MANAWTLAASGTTAQTVGTLLTLTTNTTSGTFYFEMDTALMALGDEVEIHINTITLSGGAQTQLWYGACQDVNGGITKKSSPMIPSDQSIQVQILQTAGTTRAMPWKLLVI